MISDKQITYSYSRLGSFKQCPRQYAYRYIEKPEIEKQPTIEAHLGIVCHETIQQIYKDLWLSKLMKQEEVLSFYDDRWERNKSPNLRIVRERYTEDNYRDTGRGYVKAFYETNHPFNDGKTLGIEKNVQIRLSDEVLLTGYIDRLVDHGSGHYEIIDYKTNKDLPILEDLEKNWQLPLYHIGLMEMLSDIKEVSCTWYFLAHNKPITLKKTPQNLDEIKKSIFELINQIDQTETFEPKVSVLCSWCDYETICPARKHFIETENLPPEIFAQEDGVKLVDAYIETEQKIAEEETKFEVIQEKIYNYSLQHNVTNIRGSQNKIRIWSKNGATKLIGKEENPMAGKAIVDILKKHGLWDKYSNLAYVSLVKAIESRELPEQVLKDLQPFIKKEKVWRLYSSKLKEWE